MSFYFDTGGFGTGSRSAPKRKGVHANPALRHGRHYLDTLLDLMKQAQVNIPLKAVVTPSNKNWVFGDLLAHLSEEHVSFTAAAKEQA